MPRFAARNSDGEPITLQLSNVGLDTLPLAGTAWHLSALGSRGMCMCGNALPLPTRRHQSFQSLRANLARQAKKLEEMKGVAVSTSKLKSKQRKESRLENSMKHDSAREFASLKLKQGLAVRGWPRCPVPAPAPESFNLFQPPMDHRECSSHAAIA